MKSQQQSRVSKVHAHLTSASASSLTAPAPASTHRQVIVITGIASGLGRALAETYLSLGHTVAGCARRKERIQELEQKHRAISDRILFMVCDVTNLSALDDFAAQVQARFGKVDMVVANAGSGMGSSMPWEANADEFERVLKVNTMGVFNTIHVFMPLLIASTKADGGIFVRRMITISSGLGHSVSPLASAYSASKWAVESLSKSTAQGLERVKDVAGKLICVPLSPGVVATELNTMKGCPPADKWAATAAPFILNIPPEHNGYSVCVPNYYSTEYMSTWIIPPNSPLPSNVVRPK
mmetsp:Transcript_8477/g.9987  ORF Transcript_8477/g.9987 Transcript_8477/m.9987 type:complete len:296 (-) Transcript_8477:144-1031(-)